MNVGFIGGGNMATALIKGLSQHPDLEALHVADTNPEARTRLKTIDGVRVFESGRDAAKGVDLLVLALKPQVLPAVMGDLGGQLQPHQCVLSVAAGITIDNLHAWLPANNAVVRTMPNTPAMLGLGITGMFADDRCSPAQKTQAEQVMKAVGETVWVDSEGMIDVVTAISGSGPAYYYLFTEALIDAGKELGLPPATARQLAERTALGAGAMVGRGETDAATLRQQVTSPGGTTAAAIAAFEAGGIRDLVMTAARAAAERSVELASGGESS